MKEAVRVLGELISHKQTNSLAILTSVLEVNVETALVTKHEEGTIFYFVHKHIKFVDVHYNI